MCFNSASSSSKATEVRDERIGADNGATAFRAEGTNTIHVGSDDVAQLAIESSTQALTASTDFVGQAFSDFLNLTDRRLERADENASNQQNLNAELLTREQEGNDDRLMGILKAGMFTGVAIVAIKSGVLTKTMRMMK